MLKRSLALVLPFVSSLALAQATSEEAPLEPNMTGVWIFFGILALCLVWGGWYMWRNSKKRPEEIEGDKF